MKKISCGAYDDTKGIVRAVETLLEAAILTILYYITWRTLYPSSLFPEYYYKGKYVLMGVYTLLILVFFQNSDCTLFGQLLRLDLVLGQVIALFLANFVTYFQLCLIANQMISPIPIAVLFVAQIIAAVVLIFLYAGIYHRLYAPHNMLLIYGSPQAIRLKIKMDSRQDKYQIKKLLSVDAGYPTIYKEIPKYDTVILNDVPGQMRNDILKFCYQRRIRIYIAPKLTDIIIRGAKNNTLFDTPLLLIKGTGLSPIQRLAKRIMDVVLCSIGLILTSPFMLLIAIAIKIEDGGPVFFRQDRLTRDGREFSILKFRSMVVDAEKFSGAVLASEQDPRITKVGKVIRATRLDELPQLLNILKGDMSIVGPRPERKCLADQYEKVLPEFAYRLKVKGGLTGYAQIYGKYNTSAYDKLRLDMMYIENYSLLLDLKLIFLTLRIMFSDRSTDGIDLAEETNRQAQELAEELSKSCEL